MDTFISIDAGSCPAAVCPPDAATAAGAAVPAFAASGAAPRTPASAVEAFEAAMAKPIADNAALEEAFDSAVKSFASAIASADIGVAPDGALPASPSAIGRPAAQPLETGSTIPRLDAGMAGTAAVVSREAPPAAEENQFAPANKVAAPASEAVASSVADVAVEAPAGFAAPAGKTVSSAVAYVAVEAPAGFAAPASNGPVADMPAVATAGERSAGLQAVDRPAYVPVADVPVVDGSVDVSVVGKSAVAPQVDRPVGMPAVESEANALVADRPVDGSFAGRPVAGVGTAVYADVPAAGGRPSVPESQAAAVVQPAPEGSAKAADVSPVAGERPASPLERDSGPIGETASKEVSAVKASSAPVEEVGAEEEPNADRLVAAGVAPQAQVENLARTLVADASKVQAVEAAGARTVELAERVTKAMSASEVLVQAAEAVADAILVSPGLLRGEGELRVQLKPDVLDGTEILIGVTGRQMEVVFMPQTADMSLLIEQCRPQLEQHLASRIHRFSVNVSVDRKSRLGDD